MPYIDYAALKTAFTIEQAAELLGLTLTPAGAQMRTSCPACKQGGERAIVLTPAKQLFYCFPAKVGGDLIALTAHCMGVKTQDAAHYLADQLGSGTVTEAPIGDSTVSKARATPPQKPRGRTQPAQKPERVFDPEEYLTKLAYTDEVAELGITELDSKRLGIGHISTGYHRGSIVFAMRNEDGSIAGFVGWKDGKLKFPDKWIASNVVKLRRA